MNWNPRTIPFKPQNTGPFSDQVQESTMAENAFRAIRRPVEYHHCLPFDSGDKRVDENECLLPKGLLCDDSDDNIEVVINGLGHLSTSIPPIADISCIPGLGTQRVFYESTTLRPYNCEEEKKSQALLDLFKQKANRLSITIGELHEDEKVKNEPLKRTKIHRSTKLTLEPNGFDFRYREKKKDSPWPPEKNEDNNSLSINQSISISENPGDKEKLFSYAILAPVPRHIVNNNFEGLLQKTLNNTKSISPVLGKILHENELHFFESNETRVLKIYNLPMGIINDSFYNICSKIGYIALIEFGTEATTKYIFVGYFDMRDAINAFNYFSTNNQPNCRVNYMNEDVFLRIYKPTGFFDPKILYHNRVLIEINYQSVKILETFLNSFLANMIGPVKSLTDISVFESQVQSYICEFHDCRLGDHVKNKINGFQIMPNCFIRVGQSSHSRETRIQKPIMIPKVTNHRENLKFDTPGIHDTIQLNKIISENKLRVSSLVMSNSQMCLDNFLSMNDILKLGSLDFSLGPTENIFSKFNIEDTCENSDSFIVTKASVPESNKVNLKSIARGLDTRVTMMLRNIPNKIDQQTLKDYIDVTNKGTYDFLYLRIDFLNKCNVGYAFISFTAPKHIITFAKARCGTKWTKFNSEKICDISYANI